MGPQRDITNKMLCVCVCLQMGSTTQFDGHVSWEDEDEDEDDDDDGDDDDDEQFDLMEYFFQTTP